MSAMKDRMLRGELYIADDPTLAADNARALPAGVVAFGVPAKAHRDIGDRDRVDVPDL